MPDTVQDHPPWTAPTVEVETVADRLRKLEQAIASMQNTEVVEQYVAQRVLDRLQTVPALNGSTPDGLAIGPLAAYIPTVVGAVLPGDGAGTWSRVPVFGEFRLMARMYLDPRYRLSRVAQFGVPVVIGLMVMNYFFIGFAPVVGFLVERLFLIVLSVAMYKILAREAARYASVLEYLTRYGNR
ncbi:MAG: hypothetical protein ACRC7O_13420 [Fimbriiglobus sp.]